MLWSVLVQSRTAVHSGCDPRPARHADTLVGHAPKRQESSMSSSKPANLAARMGRWSATHRKSAIFGWFGFVVLAIVVGMTISQNKITEVDQFSGESHRAEQALDGA